ncbi:protein of unknown function DUF4219 - like 6 [Theobroma cacao]|nr:protein of unknown function DUF4219 - like 6 [Theobroma cacao]
MSTSTSNVTQQSPPSFDGSNYVVWVVKMKAFLKGVNLWNAVKFETELPVLKENAMLRVSLRKVFGVCKKQTDLVSALEVDEQRKATRKDEKADHALAAHAKGKALADPSFKKNSNENKENDKASIANGMFQNKRGKFPVELLSELDTDHCSSVKIGNNFILNAIRKGTVAIQTTLGTRFMQVPTTELFLTAKKVLIYLRGTANLGLQFTNSDAKSIALVGFSDNDWARCVDDYKSTYGYVFTLGNGVFCWNSNKQETIAQSSTEAEYIEAAIAPNQAI